MAVRLLILLTTAACGVAAADGLFLLPKTALSAQELGVIVNRDDPLSRRVAAYYTRRRGTPAENVVEVALPPGRRTLGVEAFRAAYAQAQANLPPRVQALVLIWTRPYRVGCMSVTTAFATGYDDHYCGEKRRDRPCAASGRSPYFHSSSRRPYQDHGIRPTMMLAAEDLEQARRLIDRGVAADGSFPPGTAYLLSTSDRSRSVRDRGFDAIERSLSPLFRIEVLAQDALRDASDVMFYFTGRVHVEGLESLIFRPGAVADHLTSAGGQMRPPGQGSQMSSLRWLEAGATGSYGTVIEPCNFLQKFPDPGVMMAGYLGGASLVEAYWKSVAWPGEGLFIGEPLAAPFYRDRVEFTGDSIELPLNQFRPGTYRLQSAEFPVGPYRDTGRVLSVKGEDVRRSLGGLIALYYRLARLSGGRHQAEGLSHGEGVIDIP